jgi:hypothetical protein
MIYKTKKTRRGGDPDERVMVYGVGHEGTKPDEVVAVFRKTSARMTCSLELRFSVAEAAAFARDLRSAVVFATERRSEAWPPSPSNVIAIRPRNAP